MQTRPIEVSESEFLDFVAKLRQIVKNSPPAILADRYDIRKNATHRTYGIRTSQNGARLVLGGIRTKGSQNRFWILGTRISEG